MTLLWSPLAIDRVGEIAERIAWDRPRAAEQWVEDIFGAVRRLEQFPESGRPVAEVEHRADLREVLHGDAEFDPAKSAMFRGPNPATEFLRWVVPRGRVSAPPNAGCKAEVYQVRQGRTP